VIVGIGSVARVGKDTAAQALCRDLGYRRVGFADSLKQVAMICDPLVTSNVRLQNVGVGHGGLAHAVHGLGWEQAKDTYPLLRTFLQNLGDGCRRVFGDEFWIDQVLNRIGPGERVVIPDVRYINEAVRIKEAGGFLIRLSRPGHAGYGHRSETELLDYDGFDVDLDNSGTITDLERRVVEVVGDELKRREALVPPSLLDTETE